MTKKQNIPADASTEEKIKEAARKVFTKKGYAATRTRDIADEAGINLALLNYYFRSKEKLFEIIMLEKIHKLFGLIAPAMNDTTTTLEEKLEAIVECYFTMLFEHPDLPIFVLSEIRSNPDRFARLIQPEKLISQSHFMKQVHERRPDIHPIHFLFNIMGMTLFPFIAKPVFDTTGVLSEEQFNQLMQQRKQLIPAWILLMLTA